MNLFLIAIQALLMNWFITKIVYQVSSENTAHKPQFDEQLRLVEALNTEEAFLKARAIGLREEDCFLNDKQNQVRWEFINVSDVRPLHELADGQEIYSSICEVDNAKEYIRCVHEKAIYIRKTVNRKLNIEQIACS